MRREKHTRGGKSGRGGGGLIQYKKAGRNMRTREAAYENVREEKSD